MDIILNVESVVKQFAQIKAVNSLSFNVKKGEIFALLGPNGAGKTTTVRMLMNIIKPDSGSINYFLNGKKESAMPLPSQLGYLPEERGLYQEIPIMRTLEYMGIIRGMESRDAIKSAENWLAKLELLERKNEKLNALSKGNQQKIQFISSVLHNPQFAILDEPFSGFDPLNQETFLAIIKELRDRGTTILLSAHQMHLVEKIADTVLLLNNGKRISGGTVDEIKKESTSGEILIINFEGETDFHFLKTEDAVERYEIVKTGELVVYLKRGKSLSGLLNKSASELNISSVRTEHISLHDIFISRVNKDKEENYGK